ncbi:BET1 homolog [Oscarella lobularis]|uniref:BET1 homolog n=1 Tax=Oscarella lobularis TaxID=121494 RepID=UPI003313F14C
MDGEGTKMRRPVPGDTSTRSALQTEEMVEHENDRMVEEMTHKVTALKSLTIDIGDEVRSQNKFLKNMNDDFDKTGGFLASTYKRVKKLGREGHHRWICYMFLFVVAVFVITYYLIR